jgi:hypothetical protein
MQLHLLALRVELTEVEQKFNGVVADFEVIGIASFELIGCVRVSTFRLGMIHGCPAFTVLGCLP